MPVFFDTETSGLFGADDDAVPDLHCICAYDSETLEFKRFYEPTGGVMTAPRVEEAARYLLQHESNVVGFNSAAYDLRLMASHCADDELKVQLSELAFGHVDVILSFWCRAGYPASLQSFASAMNCGSKLMDGQDAIQAWRNGELATVLKYCDGDCKLLADVYSYITTNGRFARISKAGRLQTIVVDNYRLETALQALERLGELDVSWMTEPITPNITWAFEQLGLSN